jgi:hypothetical protein
MHYGRDEEIDRLMAIRMGTAQPARVTSVITQTDQLRIRAQTRLSGARTGSVAAACNPAEGGVPSFSRVSMIDFNDQPVPRVAGRPVEPDDSDW